jgi:2-haloacid dehalogenase
MGELLDTPWRARTYISRRSVLLLGGAALTASFNETVSRDLFQGHRIKAVAFDAFAIFDIRPVFAACESAFPGQGSNLSKEWRARQFEYQWLAALAGKYQDFVETTRNALKYAARSINVAVSDDTSNALTQTYMHMTSWPDAAATLDHLKRSGKKTLLLSNATEAILHSSLTSSGLQRSFDYVLSTDRIATYKPDPRAYQMAIDRTGYGKQEILFVAFAGWDAAGARWFGYPTFWNNRLSSVAEELGVRPDFEGASLDALTTLLELGR